MDYIYKAGINVIQDVQFRFSEHENFMNAINQVADPSYTFSIIVPILSTFNTHLTADVLMVSVLSEWSNMILKWFIQEDRPFWWVRETKTFKPHTLYLKQNFLTCETSPGCPSGHLMGFSSLMYVLVSACIRFYSQRNERAGRGNNKTLATVFWAVYIISLMFVSTARMFAATHFPHQCFIGAILGFMIGHFFGNSNKSTTRYWHNSSKLRLFSWVLLATAVSISAYWIQKALGIDPQWSVKMAFKWCENIQNVHVSTTPLFSLVRDTGLGLGLVSVSPIAQKTPNRHNVMVSAACVLVFCMALHLAHTAVPTIDAKVFYTCQALLQSTLPFFLIGVIPNIATVKNRHEKRN